MHPTSPQLLSGDYFKPKYTKKCDFSRKCPNMVIWSYLVLFGPRTQKNWKFWIFHFHWKWPSNTLPTSHQPLSGDHFKAKYVRKCVLGPKCPNMVIRSQAPQKLKISIFFIFARSNSPIYVQRAINHYLEIILRKNMSKNVFWAQNAQIWLLGPRPPKKWIFKNFHFH